MPLFDAADQPTEEYWHINLVKVVMTVWNRKYFELRPPQRQQCWGTVTVKGMHTYLTACPQYHERHPVPYRPFDWSITTCYGATYLDATVRFEPWQLLPWRRSKFLRRSVIGIRMENKSISRPYKHARNNKPQVIMTGLYRMKLVM